MKSHKTYRGKKTWRWFNWIKVSEKEEWMWIINWCWWSIPSKTTQSDAAVKDFCTTLPEWICCSLIFNQTNNFLLFSNWFFSRSLFLSLFFSLSPSSKSYDKYWILGRLFLYGFKCGHIKLLDFKNKRRRRTKKIVFLLYRIHSFFMRSSNALSSAF